MYVQGRGRRVLRDAHLRYAPTWALRRQVSVLSPLEVVLTVFGFTRDVDGPLFSHRTTVTSLPPAPLGAAGITGAHLRPEDLPRTSELLLIEEFCVGGSDAPGVNHARLGDDVLVATTAEQLVVLDGLVCHQGEQVLAGRGDPHFKLTLGRTPAALDDLAVLHGQRDEPGVTGEGPALSLVDDAGKPHRREDATSRSGKNVFT
jgi:hypothetical protein